MSISPARGLPPRIYLPIVLAIAVVFLSVMVYLLRIGLGVTGTALGPSDQTLHTGAQVPANVSVDGGPPAAVRAELQDLRNRIARAPNDDVALVQLADFYLAANKFRDALPLYMRALKANPQNAAARAGLQDAQNALQQKGLP